MKKIIILFLMFITALSTKSYAADQAASFTKTIDANGRAWTISQGGTTDPGARLYRAVDSTGAKSWATVNPSSASIIRNLQRGINGVAVAYAVAQAVGFAVDYIIDNSKAQIKPIYPNGADYYSVNGSYQSATAQETCEKVKADTPDKLGGAEVRAEGEYCKGYGGIYNYNGNITGVLVKSTRPTQIPFNNISPTILDQANKKNPDARNYVSDAIDKDVLNNDATTINNITNQIISNYGKAEPYSNVADTSTNTSSSNSTTNNTYNTYNSYTTNNPPPEKFELPAFCSWAEFLCQTQTEIKQNTKDTADELKKQTEQDKTFFDEVRQKYDEAKSALTKLKDDFFALFEKPADENTEINVDDNSQQNIDTNISMAAQCPAPIVYEADYHGIKSKWGVSDFSPFCNILESIIRPILIAMASFSAVLIIAGVNQKDG